MVNLFEFFFKSRNFFFSTHIGNIFFNVNLLQFFKAETFFFYLDFFGSLWIEEDHVFWFRLQDRQCSISCQWRRLEWNRFGQHCIRKDSLQY